MMIELDKLTNDGDVIDLEDGRQLQLRIEPDDQSVFDDEFFGNFAWVKRDRWTGRDQERPSDFDGNAEKMSVYGGDSFWWQPPAELEAKRGSKEFEEFRQLVKKLAEYGFVGVILELLEGEDAYGRPIVKEVASLWHIDSLENGYLEELLPELLSELDLS